MRTKITADLKQAIASQDKEKTSVLRLLEAALQNAEIKKNREKLTEDEILKVIKSEVKKREESIQIYKENNKEEQATKELKEAEILKQYLPEQLSEDKIKEIVAKIKEEQGIDSPKDFGKLMGAVMKEVKGQASGELVQRLVNESLNKEEGRGKKEESSS